MLTESYSFVRAQTSHKGEAATWSAYSWIRACPLGRYRQPHASL